MHTELKIINNLNINFMKNLFLLFILIQLSFSGKSQTKLAYDVYYYKNPKHILKTYNNILVITNAAPKTKKALLKAIKKSGYKITFANDIFPPIKQYSNQEVEEVMKAQGIDAILYYTIKGTSIIETGTYGSYTIPPKGGQGNYTAYQTTRSYTAIEAAIVEPNTKDIQEVYYYGGANGNSFDVTYRVFNKILSRLEKAGIATPPAKTN